MDSKQMEGSELFGLFVFLSREADSSVSGQTAGDGWTIAQTHIQSYLASV